MAVSTDSIDVVIESLKSIRDLRKQMDLQEKSLLDALYFHMKEDEELLDAETGEVILTYKYTKPAEYFDRKRFRFENEELYNKYVEMRDGFRRLLIK